MAKDVFGKDVATDDELNAAIATLRKFSGDSNDLKFNSIINLKLNALLHNSQQTLRIITKAHCKPSAYDRMDKDLKKQADHLDKDINEILNIGINKEFEKIGNWWVTNHDTVPENKRVSGPYTTSDDAGRARTLLERFENHNNYWIERLEEA